MLRVVSFVLAVVCKRMQQLPTMLGAAVHRRGKDTDYKTSMRVSGPNNIGRAMHYASNIVGIHFGDHRTKEILRVVSSKVLLVSNFAQQLPTTRNNMQQSVQKDATYDNQQCCIRLQGAYYVRDLRTQ